MLNGSLGVESGETFSYQFEITDSAGVIQGYARTFLKEANDTKAAITGTLDKKAGTLTFAETGIVYNNGFKSNAIICLLQAKLTYRSERNGHVLSGPVSSNDVGYASCSKGSIRFEEHRIVDELFREAAVDTIKPAKSNVPPVKPTAPVRMPTVVVSSGAGSPSGVTGSAPVTVSAPDQITTGVEKVYDWQTDTVVFEIWDGGRVDGDMVTVLYNGAPILTGYTLTKAKRKIVLPLTGADIHKITILAINEGNEPPNTANILLHDGATEYAVVAYNKIGKEAYIKIRKAAGSNRKD